MDPAVLRIVAGKGGVGRSTVAAALAANAAASGKRVLAVDAVGSGGLAGVIENAGLEPELEPDRFEVLRLTTRESLDQYLKIYLKLPLGPSRLGPLAKIFDYVSAAAPGVRELLIIGKIGWEALNGGWDEIIVDAPATGHVVELLTAPQSIAELVPAGPLAQQTDWLAEVLRAPSTSVVVVTLPEELPVSETGELLARLRAETETSVGPLVVNRSPVAIGAPGVAESAQLRERGSSLARTAALACVSHRLASTQMDRLAQYELATVIVGNEVSAPVDAVRRAMADFTPTGNADGND